MVLDGSSLESNEWDTNGRVVRGGIAPRIC